MGLTWIPTSGPAAKTKTSDGARCVQCDVLSREKAQVVLTERDHTIETSRIVIRMSANHTGVEGIPVVNEIARCPQETVDGISERAGHLLHPCAAGLLVDSGDLYVARLQIDHEEDQVPLETGQREHFDGKEVGSCEAGPVCQQERLPRRALTPLGGWVDPVSCRIRFTVFRATS